MLNYETEPILSLWLQFLAKILHCKPKNHSKVLYLRLSCITSIHLTDGGPGTATPIGSDCQRATDAQLEYFPLKLTADRRRGYGVMRYDAEGRQIHNVTVMHHGANHLDNTQLEINKWKSIYD